MKSLNRVLTYRSAIALSALLGLALSLSAFGCELVASVDRTTIGEPGFGGSDPQGMGGMAQGLAGSPQGSGGDPQGSGGDPQGSGGATPDMGGAGGDTSIGGAAGGPDGKIIYLTGMPKKANFGGISGADAQCNAGAPSAGMYKALLVDGTTRVACTSANCTNGAATEGLDWALAPSTKYVREDGTTVIGTTNEAAVFALPLAASIGTTGYSYWTGLSTDWTTSADTCSGWTQTAGFFATEGLADASDAQAISGINESCATLAGAFFACVEQ